jgi:hypothetical protein
MSILLSLLFALNCSASIQDDRAEMLLNAQDVKTLKTKGKSFEEYKILHEKCDFELSHTLVPKSCYKLQLSKEKNQVIDKACERASYIMTEEMATTALSPRCARLIGKKNLDIKYSKEEDSPEKYILTQLPDQNR